MISLCTYNQLASAHEVRWCFTLWCWMIAASWQWIGKRMGLLWKEIDPISDHDHRQISSVCCVLCAVCCVLCAVCCVLCAVCCVLYAVCCVCCLLLLCALLCAVCYYRYLFGLWCVVCGVWSVLWENKQVKWEGRVVVRSFDKKYSLTHISLRQRKTTFRFSVILRNSVIYTRIRDLFPW
jgi:hypothetical protein